MKPHLRREWSALCKCYMWFCRGGGAMGLGDKPKESFFDWRHRLSRQQKLT
jgi:hypothetical protein